jgi:hypothetical protein
MSFHNINTETMHVCVRINSNQKKTSILLESPKWTLGQTKVRFTKTNNIRSVQQKLNCKPLTLEKLEEGGFGDFVSVLEILKIGSIMQRKNRVEYWKKDCKI